MESLGRHILIDWYGCENVDAPWEELREFFYSSLMNCKFNVLSDHHHQFQPHGLSVMFILAESHFAGHIWVEEKFISFDLYWCGKSCEEMKFLDVLRNYFKPKKEELQFFQRGFF
jgi:S-adenosylmethionine decarboxylase